MDQPVGDGGKAVGFDRDNEEPSNVNIPVFMERVVCMIDDLSDDVVCWSAAGDSFIVKKVSEFEDLLPCYYNHKNFMSFVRQLNFYGFRRFKRKSTSPSRSTNNAGESAAAAQTSGPELWEEFSHPLFRRGRRDLLAGIKRHKDGARLKRKEVDSQELGMLNSLREDVDALSGDLKAANGKLGSIMSLLMGVASSRTASNDAVQSGGVSSGDCGSHFESGTDGSAAATSTEAFHGGGVGSQQRRGGGGESDGGSHREGHTSYEVGTPLGCHEAPCLPTDHPWYSRSSSSTNRYSVGPHQVQHDEFVEPPLQPLPPLAEAIAARASEGFPTWPSHQQLPTLRLSTASTRLGEPKTTRSSGQK